MFSCPASKVSNFFYSPVLRNRIIITYMLNIVWDFQTQFYKIAIVSQCHKPKSADLPQVIEHIQKNNIVALLNFEHHNNMYK